MSLLRTGVGQETTLFCWWLFGLKSPRCCLSSAALKSSNTPFFANDDASLGNIVHDALECQAAQNPRASSPVFHENGTQLEYRTVDCSNRRPMTDNAQPEPQRDVQRLMGRCLLRLQQYERLMKAMLAHHELGGSMDQLEAQRAARVEKFSGKSLGTLVKALFESYVVVEGTEEPVLDDEKIPPNRISMSVQSRMEMAPERRAEVKAAIDDLVVMRNELVHHLIERFDVWTDQGCVAAVEHLNQCYERIDRHFEELRHWAESMEEARSHAASFAQSDVFLDMLVNGIARDGAIDWPHTGIVHVLLNAAKARATEGWARLDDATAWLAKHHPEQVPQKYGCRSWPQVLSESKSFRLEYRLADDGQRVAWYRALA